ncbi:MAG: MBOAT family protein [Magnetococcales bacterium]|nr:MBOAT family protein [Magnetococcales bacterium]
MLFNSFTFIMFFLPVTWIVYQFCSRFIGSRIALYFLTAASLVFYSYWEPRYLLLILMSIGVNFAIGTVLVRLEGNKQKLFLAAGICLNIIPLIYYKYTNFLVENINIFLEAPIDPGKIILPIGLSFFTFQQLSFLVDACRRKAIALDFMHYALFVTFFPQLIAGPIVHHQEVMPQFAARADRGDTWRHLAIGSVIFIIGLFKKVVIADTIALRSTPIFAAVATGYQPGFFDAWGAAFCYAFQIYFDFSGYSDMAVGLGWMFGIKLPINFASPYKANSIIDFWRRWHITLSRFLRDYLYIPLGGSRCSPARHHLNLMLTMILGGLWHGAGWTFLLWGLLHGLFLSLNQGWQRLFPPSRSSARRVLGRIVTLLSVVLAWVPFRADSLQSVLAFYRAMIGLEGLSLPTFLAPLLAGNAAWFANLGIVAQGTGLIHKNTLYIEIPLLLTVCWALPNTFEWLRRESPGLPTGGYPATQIDPLGPGWTCRFDWSTAVFMALLFTVCLVKLNDISEFIYFQF